MKACLTLILTLIVSFSAIADDNSIVVTNRKTDETLKIECVDECEQIKVTKVSNKNYEYESFTMSQDDFKQRMNRGAEDDKLNVKDHFFVITQGISKLPWEDGEFRVLYFVLGFITIPLTAAGVGLDVAFLPISTVSFLCDTFDGNNFKKAMRKFKRNKSYKVSNRRFGFLKSQLTRP